MIEEHFFFFKKKTSISATKPNKPNLTSSNFSNLTHGVIQFGNTLFYFGAH